MPRSARWTVQDGCREEWAPCAERCAAKLNGPRKRPRSGTRLRWALVSCAWETKSCHVHGPRMPGFCRCVGNPANAATLDSMREVPTWPCAAPAPWPQNHLPWRRGLGWRMKRGRASLPPPLRRPQWEARGEAIKTRRPGMWKAAEPCPRSQEPAHPRHGSTAGWNRKKRSKRAPKGAIPRITVETSRC